MCDFFSRKSGCAKVAYSQGAGAWGTSAHRPGIPWALGFRVGCFGTAFRGRAACLAERPDSRRGAGSATARDRAGKVLPKSLGPRPRPQDWDTGWKA